MSFEPSNILYYTALILFIISLTLMALIYIGYPVFALLLSRLLPKPVRKADIMPSVSIIIAAYNEEKDLAAKLQNTLALDYPRELLEIIVASDCSTDGTDDIVRSYAHTGVRLHRQNIRHGKTIAQHNAVKISTGEILIFSDATTLYEHDVVKQIVRGFADPEVGCVSGQLIYVDKATTAVGHGCRSYWSYEKFIKQCESEVGSLIGVSGCLYAVRRSSHAKLAIDMIDDFVIATEIHLMGLRTIYEPQAISVEDTNHKTRDEFRMRVRVIEQTISALNRYSEVLNPLKHGMFAIEMLCHKVMRYSVPIWLAVAFISNLALMPYSSYFAALLLAQTAFYGIALAGLIAERLNLNLNLGPLAIPHYFVLVNAASAIAFIKFFRGDNHIVWEPIRDDSVIISAPEEADSYIVT